MNIIELAREAGLFDVPYPNPANMKEVERFAALVRAAALEEAAALADEHKHGCYEGDIDWHEAGRIACAIRQLKESK